MCKVTKGTFNALICALHETKGLEVVLKYIYDDDANKCFLLVSYNEIHRQQNDYQQLT